MPGFRMDAVRAWLWNGVEPLLYCILVFAPWAINSEPRSCEKTLLALETLFAIASILGKPETRNRQSNPRLTPALKGFAILGFLLLGYILVSAWNARAFAAIRLGGVEMQYREAILWLPHSYDQAATWKVFLELSMIGGLLYGTWRWIAFQSREASQSRSRGNWPTGLNRLFWVLITSSSLMALEAIIQKLANSNYLLFIYPRITFYGTLNGNSSLGPFPYQGSGSAYFNLMWPLTLGFWWQRRRRHWERTGVSPRFGSGSDAILPLCAGLMAVCPLITTSRTGVAICLIQGFALLGVGSLGWRRVPNHLRWSLGGLVVLVAVFVAAVGWAPLIRKVKHVTQDRMGERLEIYAQVRKMIPDFDPWGAGPGSFPTVSNLYSDPTQTHWESMVHNDWMEARLSYGWVGYSLILGLMGTWITGWWTMRTQLIPNGFGQFLGVSLGGFLLDARFDIPFRTHSLHSIFAILCVIALYARRGISNG